MQIRPDSWSALFSSSHKVEWEFIIAGETYTAKDIWDIPVIEKPMMLEPVIGRCCTGSLSITVRKQPDKPPIPKAAPIIARCRLKNGAGDRYTDWREQGHFWVSQRHTDATLITLSCRDGMMLAGQTYLDKTQYREWPVPMADVVQEIASIMGVEIDPRTRINTSAVYSVDYPNEDVLMSEVLASIAAAHGGNFVMSETGMLRLVPFPGTTEPVFDLQGAYMDYRPLSTGEKTVSRVTLTDSAENQFTTGDDSGVEIPAICEYATQAMVDSIGRGTYFKNGTLYLAEGSFANGTLTMTPGAQFGTGGLALLERDGRFENGTLYAVTGRLENATFSLPDNNGLDNGTLIVDTRVDGLIGKTFLPYEMECAYLDPCIEVGDTISIRSRGEELHVIAATLKINCNPFYTCNLSNGVKDEDEEEFPYISTEDLRASRYVSTTKIYYGNRINRTEGFVSELMENDVPIARMTANANVFTMQRKNANGGWDDCIYFDPVKREYVLTGNVTVYGMITSEDLSTAGRTVINGANITTGNIDAARVQITGADDFYWNSDNIYLIDSSNKNRQIRIGRYNGSDLGIGFTKDGGKTWTSALDFDGLNTDFTEIQNWTQNNYYSKQEISTAFTEEAGRIQSKVQETLTTTFERDLEELAKKIAEGGNHIYVQLDAPTEPAKGDLWIKATTQTWTEIKAQTWGSLKTQLWAYVGNAKEPDIFVWTGTEWFNTLADLKERISSSYSYVDQTAEAIKQEVGQIEETVAYNERTIEEAKSTIEQTAKSLESEISDFKTEISDDIKSISGSVSRIEQTANDITTRVETVENSTSTFSSQIQQNAKAIESKVSAGDIISTINQSAEQVKIAASKITLEGLVTVNGNFKVLTDGSVEAVKGKFTDGSFSGTLTAGSWTFNSDGSTFASGENFVRVYTDGSTAYYNTSGIAAEYGADYKHEARVRGSSVRLYSEDVDSSISVSKQDGKGGVYNDACLVPDASNGWNQGDSHGNLGTNLKPWDVAYFRTFYYINMHNNSSRTIKHNIEDLPEMGGIIDQLNPVSFAYNFDKSEHKHFGLIYEDTRPVLPDICYVGENYNDNVSIDYIELVPILLREIKTLRRRLHEIDGK